MERDRPPPVPLDRFVIRVLLGALSGAAASAAALILFTNLQPAIVLEMNTNLPRAIAADTFYPAEIAGDETWAWSRPTAALTFRGIDRDAAWTCTVRARAARPAGMPAPAMAIAVDGLTALQGDAPADYQSMDVALPPRETDAVTLTVTVTPAFVPGPNDRRELGLQFDRVACRPDDGAFILPPARARWAAAGTGALFGGLFALLLPAIWSGAAMLVFAAAIACLLTSGLATYAPAYIAWFVPMSLGIVLAVAAGVAASTRSATPHRQMSTAAAVVIAFSGGVLLVKILALLHPSKTLVDALFHAHRLGWVLDGRYYFTQPMPGGVQFPYAIGLYVVAAPWTWIAQDHVALLRIVVCVAEAAGAALLYLLVARTSGDRLAGAAAVVLYHCAPLPYVVIGNANLTYAFGHAASVAAFALAVLAASRPTLTWTLLLSFVLTTLAFLSHVGVFPLLAVSLTATAAFYWWTGTPIPRAGAIRLGAATVIAAVIAVGAYYAHFPEVYRTLNRVSAPQAESSSPPAAEPVPLTSRLGRAGTLGLRAYGLPLTLLGIAGLGAARRSGRQLGLALAGCGVSFALFLAFRALAPVDARLQRYADEFIERVYYATLPCVAILAGFAFAACWRRRMPYRAAGTALGAATVIVAVLSWMAWTR